jgi:hypothetical protein
MSKIVADCMDVSRSPLNSSQTKQLYSFPKTERFPRFSPLLYCSSERSRCDRLYNMPSSLSTRATGIGYGTRFNKSGCIKAYD